MANKFPLILNTSANQIQELASGDNLDLTGSGIHNAGVITATNFTGAVTGNADTATLATNVNVTANNSTDETVYPLFVDGATGTQGAESDTGLTYNPSSGNLTSTQFTGTLQTAAQPNITSVGTLSALNVSGNVSIGGTLTYEDVTNIDAVGLVTARTGVVSPYADIDDWIDVGNHIQLGNAGIVTTKGADINGDLDVDGHTNLDNVSIAGVSTFTGAIDANGDLDVDGHTNLDNVSIAGVTTTGAVTWGGHMLPTTNAAYDIGSAEKKVRHLFLSDNSLKFVDSSDTEHPLSLDGGKLKFAGGMLLGNNIKLDVASGIATFQDLDVGGHTNLDNVSIAGVTTFAGNIGGTATFQDIDVDGHTNLDNVSIAGIVTISGTAPNLLFTETDANPDWGILCSGGQMKFQDMTATANIFTLDDDKIQAVKNLDALAGVDVTGNLTVNGDVKFANQSIDNAVNWGKVSNILQVRNDTKLTFGNSNQLSIYQDAASSGHSLIKGTGYLRIAAESYLQLGNAATPAMFFNCDASTGSVYIAHNGNDKIQTTNTGAVVTGICTATDFSGAAGGAADFPNGLGGTTATFSGFVGINKSSGLRSGLHLKAHSNGWVGGILLEENHETKGWNIHPDDSSNLLFGFNSDTTASPGSAANKFNINSAGGIIVYGTGGIIKSQTTSGTGSNYLQFSDTSGNQMGYVGYGSGSSNKFYIVQQKSDPIDVYIGSASRWQWDTAGNYLPFTNNAVDIGSSTKRVRNIYTNDLHLSNESSGGNDVDGTTGNYTIQEGADELYLINNKSGKKYKFNLTEVS